MPKIQWTGLPAALRDHLFDRLRERKITAEDLYQLKLWRESEPEAPEGLWYKDFGSFKICGEGKYPKTFQLKGRWPRGSGCSARANSREAVEGEELLVAGFVEADAGAGGEEEPAFGAGVAVDFADAIDVDDGGAVDTDEFGGI